MNIPSRSTVFPYIYRGIVKDVNDPLSIGRCRIHVPDIYGTYDYDSSLLPWSRPINVGGIKLPDVEDIVWVMFEDGNKQAPVYMVGVLTDKTPLESSTTDIIYESGDCKIYYDKKTKTLIIQVGDSKITMTVESIDLASEAVTVNGEPIGTGGSGSGTGGGIWYYDVVRVVT